MKKELLILLLFLLPFISQSQQWELLASEQQIASEVSAYTHITTTIDGSITVPYVVYTESGIAKVKKFDGENWVAVGDNLSAATVTYTRIYIDENGKLYVTYVDASNANRLAVKTYNDATLLWEPLANDVSNLFVSTGTVNGASAVTQYNSTPRSSLAFDSDNNPYIAFAEGANQTPYVKKFDGNTWISVGRIPGRKRCSSTPGSSRFIIDDYGRPV